MKNILLISFVSVLVACTPTKKGEPMQGKPVGGQMSAYTEMCKRNPDSILCPKPVKECPENEECK